MAGYLILFAFILCGLGASFALFREKSPLIRIWIGCCMGLVMMMCLPPVWAFLFNFTCTAQLLGLGTAMAMAGGCIFFTRKRRSENASFSGDMPLWLLCITLPLIILSAYLMYTHYLRSVDGALHVGQSTYGDLSFHLGIATNLRNAEFPPDYCILPGSLLGYPFFSDGMVTTMLLFGSDLTFSYVLTGTLMMALVYIGFVIFAWEITKSKCAVILAFVFMFINGGLGFLYTFDGVFRDSTALREVFTGFYKTPTNQPDLNLRWVNVICDMMIPQRTLLAGWCVLLPALYMLINAIRTERRFDFILLGIWAGCMPMIHTHSFFALGLASAGIAVYRVICAPAERRMHMIICYALYALCALVLALPQLMIWTFPQTKSNHGLRLLFNWVNNQGNGRLIDGYFWFWIKNVGLTYILMVPAALYAKKGSMVRTLAIGALIIYTAAELIRFQPNVYDNNKLFYVSYMMMMPAIGSYLLHIWEKLKGLRLRGLLACLFIAAGTVSGGLSIAREVVSDYQLFSADEAEAAEFIDHNTDSKSVFLTGHQHNNAVTALAGRHIVCGADTFLYYHGLDYSNQWRACELMFTDPENNQELFDEYDVSYVYISSWELSNFAVDLEWFDQNMDVVFRNASVIVYARAR